MIATSIFQKALAVLLMILIVSSLLSCKKEDLTNEPLSDILPLVAGEYIGELWLGSDSMPNIRVEIIPETNQALRVVPDTDLMAAFGCQVIKDGSVLQNTDDSSPIFFSINLEPNPFEMRILYGASGTTFVGFKSN